MTYVQTYVRPWWKVILLYLLCCIAISIVCMMISFSMVKLFTSDAIVDSIFGKLPIWIIESIAFSILSPIFGFVIYVGIVPRKYSRERRNHLIPINPENLNQVLWEPGKVHSKEPLWIENFEFEATLHLVDTVYLGRYNFMILEDENQSRYLMDSANFNHFWKNTKNGSYTGKFTFDDFWIYSTIKEVK